MGNSLKELSTRMSGLEAERLAAERAERERVIRLEQARKHDLARLIEIGEKLEASNRRILTEVGVVPLFEEILAARALVLSSAPVYEHRDETTLFGLINTGNRVRVRVADLTPAKLEISQTNDCVCVELDLMNGVKMLLLSASQWVED